MALDLGLITHQLLSTLDGVVSDARTRAHRLDDAVDRALVVPADWNAVSVDGSHIDVDRHLPLRCHLINLGGCIITYGKDFGCHLFSEPTLGSIPVGGRIVR